MRRPPISLLLYLFVCALCPLAAQPVLGIFDLDSSSFPKISAKFIALDSAHRHLTTLDDNSFSITENGILRKVTRVSCPPPAHADPISVGVMVDTYQYLDLAGLGARTLIDELALPPSEIGFTTMDKGVFIIQELTMDRERATASTERFISSPGTHLQQIFYDQHAGGVPFISGRPNRKILVLMTDLHCPAFNLDTARLWKDAARENISVYMILFNANDYYGLFNRIAEKTGGRVFERVTTEEQVREIMDQIALRDQYEPCEIEWESGPDCPTLRNVAMNVADRSLGGRATYVAPENSIPELDVVPSAITFRRVPPGDHGDSTFTVTARNSAITISAVGIDNSDFTVLAERPLPTLLLAGESMKITLGFTPRDSAYAIGRIGITSDACTEPGFFAAGIQGSGLKPPHVNTLKLIRPNGCEQFAIGDTVAIDWDGIPASDAVRLEYSIDNGTTWRHINEQVSGTGIRWVIPNSPSTRCLARVTQLVSGRNIDSLILPHFSGELRSARLSPDDSQVITADSSLRIWNAVSGELIRKAHDSIVADRAYYSRDGEIFAVANAVVNYQEGLGYQMARPPVVRVVDPVSMHVVREMDLAPRGSPVFLAFSSDGRFARYGDSYVDLVRTSTGDLLTSIYLCCGSASKSVAAFSPDGNLLATAFGWGIQIRDGHSGELIREVTSPFQTAVGSLAFSNDGTELAVGTAAYRAYTYEVPSLTLRDSVIPNNGPVYALSYSPDDSLLATANGHWSAHIWSRNNGWKLLHTVVHPLKPEPPYSPPLKPFSDIQFSRDGDVVVAANMVEGADIVTVRRHALQSDISDSLWSIVAPALTVSIPEIDMGPVLLGDSRDSLVRAVICNRGDVAVHVLGIDPSRGEMHDLQIMSGGGDFTLPPGECRNIVFQFMPMATGKHEAWFTIRTAGDTIIDAIHVTGTGFQPQLSISTPFIDFGRVPLGERTDTVVAVMVTNVGGGPVTIESVGRMGPDTTQFEILGEEGSSLLRPGESKSVRLRFTPHQPGRASGRIVFHHDGPGRHSTASLFGEGTGAELFAEEPSFSFGNLICQPGRDTTIELYNGGNADLVITQASITGNDASEFVAGGSSMPFELPITIRGSAHASIPIQFLPTSYGPKHGVLIFRSNARNTPGGTLPIALDARSGGTGFELSAESVMFDRILPRRTATASLTVTNTGTEPLTWMVPDTAGAFVLESISPAVTSASGGTSELVIRYLGGAEGTTDLARLALIEKVCGSSRGIDLSAQVRSRTLFGIDPVQPNPVRAAAEIQFHLIEPGRTVLYLVDPIGRRVATLLDDELLPGDHSATLDAGGLPSGVFYCVLQTPGQRAIQVVTIAR